MERPQVICLTPVKNEAWILKKFLLATSLWADHIILADQQSTDDSVAIARQFPKVTVIENSNEQYDEFHRQQMLVNKAREIPGKKLLIALDADEIFTANILSSPEWNTVLNAAPGTVIRAQWIHPLPRMNEAAHEQRFYFFVGLMDDGSEFAQHNALHNARLPLPRSFQQLYLNDIRLLHYNLADPDRDRSKKRWYMCWTLIRSELPPFKINRSYLHHHVLGNSEPFRREWIEAYSQQGIDLTSIAQPATRIGDVAASHDDLKLEPMYWWDEQVLEWMHQYGAKKFSKLDIWEKDWNALGKKKYGDGVQFTRRASFASRIILSYIRRTPHYRNSSVIRRLDRVLAPLYNSSFF